MLTLALSSQRRSPASGQPQRSSTVRTSAQRPRFTCKTAPVYRTGPRHGGRRFGRCNRLLGVDQTVRSLRPVGMPRPRISSCPSLVPALMYVGEVCWSLPTRSVPSWTWPDDDVFVCVTESNWFFGQLTFPNLRAFHRRRLETSTPSTRHDVVDVSSRRR